jgi:hypothetical protein
MEAMASRVTRQVRAVAVMAVLLCAFAAVGPILAREAGHAHSRMHLVKVVNPASADQHGTTTKFDQPMVAAVPVQHAHTSVLSVNTAESKRSTGHVAVLAPANRGPPSLTS